VLPTGGGKSLLFSVPAGMDNTGMTVVVVPYRALIKDLVDRMQKRGIDCIEWKHGESSLAAFVVVSADAAGDNTSNGNFIGYAQVWKIMQHLTEGVRLLQSGDQRLRHACKSLLRRLHYTVLPSRSHERRVLAH
jgi:hypothetical protein